MLTRAFPSASFSLKCAFKTFFLRKQTNIFFYFLFIFAADQIRSTNTKEAFFLFVFLEKLLREKKSPSGQNCFWSGNNLSLFFQNMEENELEKIEPICTLGPSNTKHLRWNQYRPWFQISRWDWPFGGPTHNLGTKLKGFKISNHLSILSWWFWSYIVTWWVTTKTRT